MDREGIVDDVDVLGFTLFELLQHLDLVDEVFEVLVLFASVDTIIGRIDVDDFECHDLFGLGMTTGESKVVSSWSQDQVGREGAV